MNTPEKKRKQLNYSLARINPSLTELLLTIFLFVICIVSVLLANLPFFITQLLVLILVCLLARVCHLWRQQPVYRLMFKNDQWLLIEQNDVGVDKQENTQQLHQCVYWSRRCLVFSIKHLPEQSVFQRRFDKWFMMFNRKIIFPDACSKSDFHHIKLIARYKL